MKAGWKALVAVLASSLALGATGADTVCFEPSEPVATCSGENELLCVQENSERGEKLVRRLVRMEKRVARRKAALAEAQASETAAAGGPEARRARVRVAKLEQRIERAEDRVKRLHSGSQERGQSHCVDTTDCKLGKMHKEESGDVAGLYWNVLCYRAAPGEPFSCLGLPPIGEAPHVGHFVCQEWFNFGNDM